MPQTKIGNKQLPDLIQNKTLDTSNDIDTTTTKLTISGGSNGQVLSTDGSGNLSWTTAGGGAGLGAPIAVVVKPFDESVTNSQTPQTDDHLFYAVTAFRNYVFISEILWRRASTGTAQLLRTAFDGQSEGMCYVQDNVAYALADGSSSANSPTVAIGFPDTTFITRQIATIRATTNRTVGFSWAQGVSGTNTVTVRKNSRMLVYDLGPI